MPYIPPEVVARAREMDLLTYLRTYEPQELVHFGGDTYCTREHDSLKISNGKWCWFSRGIGGYSALDYLIKVKKCPLRRQLKPSWEILWRHARLCPGSESVKRKGAASAADQPQRHPRRRISVPQRNRRRADRFLHQDWSAL